MSNSELFRDVISKMMEAVTLDKKGELKILDESAMAEADELLNKMVVETARDWWAQLESAEDSLADMADEISFSELNTDPSHVGSPELDLDADADMTDAVPTLEGMLEDKDYDLTSIFEDFGQGAYHEDEDDFGPDDGDSDFDDLMRGDDEEGLGDDGPIDDDDMDDGEDMDMIGGDDDMDFDGDMDSDMDMDMDMDMGGEEDFDFDFLDDDSMDDMDGMDDDMDEMNHFDHMREADDEDEDLDGAEDDEDEDD